MTKISWKTKLAVDPKSFGEVQEEFTCFTMPSMLEWLWRTALGGKFTQPQEKSHSPE